MKLCEVYFEKKKPYAYADLEWKDIHRDRKFVLEDMRDQTKAGIEFYDDGKRIVMIKKAAGKRKEEIIKGRLFKDTQKAFEKMKRGLEKTYTLDEILERTKRKKEV